MTRDVFDQQLRIATQHALAFARSMVVQSLPDRIVYVVYPNCSYDENPLVDDEMIFPEETLPDSQYHGPWSVDEVVAFLWRAERIPEWIDVAVLATNGVETFVALRCCGRFTTCEKLLYYRGTDGPVPFGIKSPAVPSEWQGIETFERFDLHWRTAAFGDALPF